MKMRGDELGDSERTILALIYDALVMLAWNGEDSPPSMLDAMYGQMPARKEKQKKLKSFGSPQEYEQARKRIIERRQRCQN